MGLKKCAVIGAGGVGATIAFTLGESGLFNDIVIIDIDHRKAEGEALDISHGIQFLNTVDVYAGEYKDLADAELVIITAGANQLPGETRIDLVGKNARIMKSIVENIVKYNKDCILLVVSNPADVLTMYAAELSGFPKERVFGSGTVLDTSRLRYLLSEKFNIDSRNIHAFIIGEHGDSSLAVWSNADIAGVPIREYCQKFKNDACINLNSIYEEVRDSAYHIIERKGSTYYGIAVAVKRIAQAIVRDEHSILPVSSFFNGEYGITDACLGMPSVVCRKGVINMIELSLDEEEKNKLIESANTLKKVYASIEK